jgi:hypothetical protein
MRCIRVVLDDGYELVALEQLKGLLHAQMVIIQKAPLPWIIRSPEYDTIEIQVPLENMIILHR